MRLSDGCITGSRRAPCGCRLPNRRPGSKSPPTAPGWSATPEQRCCGSWPTGWSCPACWAGACLPATDAIAGPVVAPGEDCRTDRGPAVGGYTGTSQPLPDHTTYVGLGEVTTTYAVTPAATQAQLEALPGIGPSLAQAIIQERDRAGGFHSVDDLRWVRGIGDVRFAQLRPLVTV